MRSFHPKIRRLAPMTQRTSTLAAMLFLPLFATAQAGEQQETAKAPTETPAVQQAPARPPAPAFKMWHPRTPKDEASHKVAKWGPRNLPSPGYAFFAEKILPVTSAPIFDGVIITKNGIIEAIGKASEIAVPSGYERVDCGDSVIIPGIVELHCHIASPSFDLNDTVNPTNPEFRTLDLISMEHDQIKLARAGGVSTALYIPGSGSTWAASARSPRPGASHPKKHWCDSPAASRSPKPAIQNAAAATSAAA